MSANKSFTCRLHHLNAHCAFLVIFIQVFLPFAHSVSFDITSFDPTANNILYEGDAKPSLGNIELNAVDYGCRVGRAVYSEPIRLWDSSTKTPVDFTTQLSFIIDTRNATTYYGDGFAYFLAPVDNQTPPNSAGPFLGLFNSSKIDPTPQNRMISVEFDSFVNSWDPPKQHVGINNNSIASAVSVPWDAGSNSGKLANVWITYNATTKNLSVFWTYDEHPVFMGNCSLSYPIDLMTILPEWVKIGFSTSTGHYKENNTITSWKFTSNYETKQVKRSKKKSISRYVIVLVPVCSLVALVFGLLTGWLQLKTRKGNTRNIIVEDRNGHANGMHDTGLSAYTHLEGRGLPKRFFYQELFTATNGFADDERLGRGGSAHVYKGKLDDQRLVAVKRIFAESEGFFINELKIISRVMHRNLVKFIGWCHDQNELLLVYEYMPNGCLESHLHGNNPPLPWDVRYKIAMGLASALHYLLDGEEQCVLHRDIKSANVLLDTDFTTKLGDFGVSKLVDQRPTQTTMVVGTFGHIAPEYMQEGRARKETDMYSFGIVALEIACGRKPNRNGALLRMVWHLYTVGYILDAADGRLENFDENEMRCLLMVGLWCNNPNHSERPNAGQVVKVLEGEAPLPELPRDMHDHPAPLSPLQIDTSDSGSQNVTG